MIQKANIEVTEWQAAEARAEMYTDKIRTAIAGVLKDNNITAKELIIALRGNVSQNDAEMYKFGGENHYPAIRNRFGGFARLNLADFIENCFNTKR